MASQPLLRGPGTPSKPRSSLRYLSTHAQAGARHRCTLPSSDPLSIKPGTQLHPCRPSPGVPYLVVVDEAIAAVEFSGALSEVPAVATSQALTGARAGDHGIIQDPRCIANHTGT